MKRQNCLFVSFFLCIVLFYPAKLLAAPYYEGKKIIIVVGYGPGGGYDRLARLFAKHLPKYIPGKPNIIVENMPGAGSIIAANHVYSIAKLDGSTVGTLDRGLPLAQLTKVEGVRYDMLKYSWIGSAAVESTVLVIRTDLPYKTFEDLTKAKEPIALASMGPATADTQFPILLKKFLKLNVKMINYPSSADGMLAIERKEVDCQAGSYSSLKPFIERGLVRPLIRGRVSEPGIENLPVDEDLTHDVRGKTFMAIRSALGQIGRPYVAPPGTPVEVMNILREGFARTAKDPELQEDSKKFRMTVEYVPADECLKVLNYILTQPADIVKELSEYLKF